MGIIFKAREILGDNNFNSIGYYAQEKGNKNGYDVRQQ
jgi:hypothetical protein